MIRTAYTVTSGEARSAGCSGAIDCWSLWFSGSLDFCGADRSTGNGIWFTQEDDPGRIQGNILVHHWSAGFFGTLAIYLGATAPEEKRELGERVMRGGLIAVVTALIMLVGRVVLKRFL